MHLGDSVDGPGPLDGNIGRRIPGRVGTEGPDGAGNEQAQLVLFRQLHDVVKSCLEFDMKSTNSHRPKYFPREKGKKIWDSHLQYLRGWPTVRSAPQWR